jgi:hypothetical protein
MRICLHISIALTSALLPSLAFSQQASVREILTESEYSYPSAKAPVPFSPDSAASGYAAEPEDRFWSPAMEARILEEVEKERSQGLVVRRADVECRSSTCVVLLVHATSNGSEGTMSDLIDNLKQNLGFASVSTAERAIPLVLNDGSDTTRSARSSTFVSGYFEIVLVGGINENLQARQNSQ